MAMLGGPAVSDITLSRGWYVPGGMQPKSVSTYANAKVLLLGDSGVGKTSLGMVLAGKEFSPTESTHGRRIWLLQAADAVQ